jgi:hypothetical protein
LQKWKAASLNTGFSSIFDFGGPFKDGSITFTKFQKSTHQLIRGKQKNILPNTLIDVHLFFPNGPLALRTDPAVGARLAPVNRWFHQSGAVGN